MVVKIDRTGEKFISNEGYEFVIIQYYGCHDLYIRFLDGNNAIIHTGYENCRRGNVKNPYHKSVYGVGYLGLLPDGSKPPVKVNGTLTKEYRIWNSMIGRCYDEKSLIKNPTYEECTVCDRWLCYANFLQDIHLIEGHELLQTNDRITLDKDIKGNNSKIYSLETCCFCTQSDNSKERYKRCGNPNNNSKKVYGISIETGEKTEPFNTIKEAQETLKVNGISAVLRGKQKSAGGYYWFLQEE